MVKKSEKRVSKFIKSKIGNFRIQKYRINKRINKAAVEVSFWCDFTLDDTITPQMLNRGLDRLIKAKLNEFTTNLYTELGMISVYDIPSYIFIKTIGGSNDGFVKIDYQFNPQFELTMRLDELIYDIIIDSIIGVCDDNPYFNLLDK